MKGKIFNAQEVQAIIAGNKTMFREVLKVQPTNENQVFSTVASSIRNKDIGTHNFINPKATWEQTKKFKCPYQVGQKIFVKEKFARSFDSEGNPIAILEADNKQERKWRPAQHMKQEHSRITLQITSIRVERLGGDISEENLPQGFRQIKDRNHFMYDTHIKRIPCNCGNSSPTLLSSVNIRTFLKESAYKFMCPECKKTPNETYITSNGASCVWNDLIDPSWREKSESTHKKPEEKFEANPFVWVVNFKINK